ncbi:DNA-binding transcriptional LysR family regulator [Streptomyces sp. V3I8]|uniref:LysR family transcriptional regulator n=1 Tax=Streptomyces sp. V3I8 TaxID=3042279 RepID=UPI0027831023|nr:LysR family transcriptional regulator [Streptomyces sp. V3I8]MDQ1033754.1 DNA-binding transcriptional LysR family regulator [Streptomyces sp. V3I8]
MQLDLNLLTALDALLEEGSVTDAAARLHVSAPAMSRTLGRIRRATGDQILVRTGRTMTPTPRALALRATVHDLVQQAHSVLSPHAEVDLAVLERTFILKWHDALAAAAGPALLRSLRAEAPGVRVRFLAEASTDTHDPRRGDVDLEAGASAPASPEIRHEIVGHDRLVLALRSGHPLSRGPLTLEDYAAAEHVTVSRRGRLRDPIDDVLEAGGLGRHVVAAAPTIATALQFVRHHDLVVPVPELMSRPLLDGLGLCTRPLPPAMPPIPVHLTWHHRYDNDPAHIWLRARARTALADACGRPADDTADAAADGHFGEDTPSAPGARGGRRTGQGVPQAGP